MSFDKQNFARSVAEQQAGIAPQMWPIKIDPGTGTGRVSLNSPFEIEINPCDSIWLPFTYDKSYGVHPIQNDPAVGYFWSNPAVCGANMYEIYDTHPNGPNFPFQFTPPTFGLRFNSPNNPWLLWGLACASMGAYGTPPGSSPLQAWGSTAPSVPRGYARQGAASMMRSITGPISRLWCQFYLWAEVNGAPYAASQQVMLMSMLGFNQETREFVQPVGDFQGVLPGPPAETQTALNCGAYRTTDLNSADLRVLGQSPYPAAPPTSGKGSTGG